MAGRQQKRSSTAFQKFQNQLGLVDLVFEIVDARAPLSSRHPQSAKLFGNKPRVIILAKQDLADPEQVSLWVKQLDLKENQTSLALSLKHAKGKDQVINKAWLATKSKREALLRRGLNERPMRACVVGMPNVGKSTFINWIIGAKKTLTGNKPGVTVGTQWIRIHPRLELLDTPGILPPITPDVITATKLALLNLIPENTYDASEVVDAGFQLIEKLYPDLMKTYGIDLTLSTLPLEQLAKIRNCIGPEGKLDTHRSANIFLGDLRIGKFGRITLDR